jgi:glycosyltransferase involved in cell wall biosynthesis
MPKSILYILHYTSESSKTFDQFLFELAEQAATRNWSITYALDAEPTSAFSAAIHLRGGHYLFLPFPFTAESRIQLIKLSPSTGYDLILTSFLSSFTKPLLHLKQSGFTRKLVILDHTSGSAELSYGLRRIAKRIRGWWVGRIIDAILPVSNWIANRDIERVFLPSKKISTVYDGIPLDRCKGLAPPNHPVGRIAFAGQLMPYKGVLTLLRALIILRSRGHDIGELHLAGKGDQEGELKAFCQTNNLNHVRFLGHIHSVPELFASADLVVIPSEWMEAFGLVAAEAMACGCAIIASDAGALPEVIADAGVIFPSGNAEKLADAIQQLQYAMADRQELGEIARTRAFRLFELKTQLDKRMQVIEAVLKDQSIPRFEDHQIAEKSIVR